MYSADREMRTGTRVLHEKFHPEGEQSLVAALWPLIVDMVEWVDELYITNGGLQVPEENGKYEKKYENMRRMVESGKMWPNFETNILHVFKSTPHSKTTID